MQKILQKGGKAPCFTQTQGSSNPNSCTQTRAHHRIPLRELGHHWCSTWALRTALVAKQDGFEEETSRDGLTSRLS